MVIPSSGMVIPSPGMVMASLLGVHHGTSGRLRELANGSLRILGKSVTACMNVPTARLRSTSHSTTSVSSVRRELMLDQIEFGVEGVMSHTTLTDQGTKAEVALLYRQMVLLVCQVPLVRLCWISLLGSSQLLLLILTMMLIPEC